MAKFRVAFAAVGLFTAQAQAGVCPVLAPVSIAGVGYSCTLGDVTFSNFTITGVPATALLEFGQLGPLSAVTLERDGAFLPVGTTIFDFTITTPQPIVLGAVGVDVSFPTVTTVITMNGQALPTITNSGTEVIFFSPGSRSVTVDNTSHILTSTSEWNSLTDNFSQVPIRIGVLEPDSLLLMGLGISGLAFVWNRRRPK